MRNIIILVLILFAMPCDARTLTGSLEFKIRSNLNDVTGFGNVSDNLDYSGRNDFTVGETHGAIDTMYRADREVGTAAVDVVGLVGSLTNAIGEVVSFTTVKAVYLENLTSTGTLTISGLATATVMPRGSFSLVGNYTVASISDRLNVSTTATTTYRIWLVGD